MAARRHLFPGLALMALIAVLVAAVVVRDYRVFLETPLELPAPRGFLLRPGTSYRELVAQLRADGVTHAPELYWRLLAWEFDAAGRMQAGEYLLDAGTSPLALMQLLISGSVRQYALTIVEGWTYRQLLAAIADAEPLEHTLPEAHGSDLMSALGLPDMHPEGRFLPETYHFPGGTSDVAFLRRAFEAMSQALEQAWISRDGGLPYATPDEVLIMASIIEKETAIPEERGEIAGVFVRRLQQRMRLQTDPTVIYGLGPGFSGDIRFEDLKRDTPYNTYTRYGLPPTPIALPGRDSLEAAVHPEPGASLYFVATGDGGHVFSDTLEEHNRNVARYQKGRRTPKDQP